MFRKPFSEFFLPVCRTGNMPETAVFLYFQWYYFFTEEVFSLWCPKLCTVWLLKKYFFNPGLLKNRWNSQNLRKGSLIFSSYIWQVFMIFLHNEAKYMFPKCDGANCSKKKNFRSPDLEMSRKKCFFSGFSLDFLISFSWYFIHRCVLVLPSMCRKHFFTGL